MEKKNRLSQRLGQRLQSICEKNKKLKPKEKEVIHDARRKISQSAPDYNRFRFRLYFESSCPHCKRMFQTMKDLQTRGYFVELKQIDKGPKGPMRLPFPVTYASRKEVKEKNINSWPTLFIGDLKKKIVLSPQGLSLFFRYSLGDSQSLISLLLFWRNFMIDFYTQYGFAKKNWFWFILILIALASLWECDAFAARSIRLPGDDQMDKLEAAGTFAKDCGQCDFFLGCPYLCRCPHPQCRR